MGKYINTNDLELEVSHYLQCEKESEAITLEELKEIINRLPSFEHFRGADMCDFYIDEKHGKWTSSYRTWEFTFECSACGKENYEESNFCPHCGADMRERKDEE